MKTSAQKATSWINSRFHQNRRLFLIATTGIFSGVILIWYENYFSTTSFSNYWWMIPISSLIWMLLRIFLPRHYLLFLSILYFLGNLIYGLLLSTTTSVTADFLFTTSFLLTAMSTTEYLLFSQYTSKFIMGIFFAFLLVYEILPAVVLDFHLSYLHLFLLFLLFVLVTSSSVVVVSELIIFGALELLGQVQKNEKE